MSKRTPIQTVQQPAHWWVLAGKLFKAFGMMNELKSIFVKQSKQDLSSIRRNGRSYWIPLHLEIIYDTSGSHENVPGCCRCKDSREKEHQNLYGKVLLQVRDELKQCLHNKTGDVQNILTCCEFEISL